jgi:hypothetical protein
MGQLVYSSLDSLYIYGVFKNPCGNLYLPLPAIPPMHEPVGQWVTTCAGTGQGSGTCGSTRATAYG